MSEPARSTPERLVLFTDAVAAIALTLLVLPLVETVTEDSSEHRLGELVHEHLPQVGAFVLSFAVIFRFWWSHHRVFQHVATLRPSLVAWSGLWTFGIVLMPIPTAIITAYSPSPASVAMYGGTLVLTSGSLTMLALLVYRHPEMSDDRPRATREEVLGTTTVFAAQLLATVVGATFAHTVNYWAFLLMFLTGPVERLVTSRWRRTTT
ncbi:TMEM175 family protein [Actinophytocola oryzae]|uniref:Putative membrane protein n=1 Tax=Actinophytocola oryzae TaxID=502181 RepID=A0A4R7UTY7_9PSEU|nr:TMEM175 family protein [Actinophytocola oryzae]TDV40138.1 putative membrane protein [Actinophytocola oryzae]